MDLKETFSKIPPWGWVAGGGVAIGLVVLLRNSGSGGTVPAYGQSSEVTDALQGLTGSLGNLQQQQQSQSPPTSAPTQPRIGDKPINSSPPPSTGNTQTPMVNFNGIKVPVSLVNQWFTTHTTNKRFIDDSGLVRPRPSVDLTRYVNR